MRIGTLTFHRAPNVGAILQAYALQRTLKDLGYDTEMIDYRRDCMEPIFAPSWVIRDACYYKFCEGLLVFITKNYRLSRPYYDRHDMVFDKEYDWLLAGSDQIWNPNIVAKDPTWLLEFPTGKTKLASYSGSFGVTEIPDHLHSRFHTMFAKMDSISIREESARDIMRQFMSKFEVTLDPTLLLTPTQWNTVIDTNEIDLPDSPYIIVYLLVPDDLAFQLAQRLKSETGCPIVVLADPGVIRTIDRSNLDYCAVVSPSTFLESIAKAEYVVTHSLHGTLFSINYQKTFFVTSPDNVIKNWPPVSSRITSMLSSLGLSRRQISHEDQLHHTKIDYREITKTINEKRTHSLNYLKQLASLHDHE